VWIVLTVLAALVLLAIGVPTSMVATGVALVIAWFALLFIVDP
jgi:hypothetical protein